MSDNGIDYRGILDEIAKVIEVNGEEGGGYFYADLPDHVRERLAEIADPYSERNQAASAWMAISTHPLIGDLPSLPERGTYAESVRARLDEIAAKASLPEPDATNPNHLRWAAKMIEITRPGGDSGIRGGQRNVLADGLRAEADRLDAAQSAEREREQRIEAARAAFKATSGIDTSPADGWMEAIVDTLYDGGVR